MTEYEAAVQLYQGDFLAGDLYEEWPVLLRERLRVAYLDVLDHLSQIYFNQDQYADCMHPCQLHTSAGSGREDMHCLLMRCYSRQGQHHLAMRQYQDLCRSAPHGTECRAGTDDRATLRADSPSRADLGLPTALK